MTPKNPPPGGAPKERDWAWYRSSGHLANFTDITPRHIAGAQRLLAYAEEDPEERAQLLADLVTFFTRLRQGRKQFASGRRTHVYRRQQDTTVGVGDPEKTLDKPRTEPRKVTPREVSGGLPGLGKRK